MIGILVLGFLIGMRHALEVDHLAAVATLVTRSRNVGGAVLRGVAWGLGHTITLFIVGGVCLLLNLQIPEHWERAAEGVVGVMLVLLGLDVFRRLRRRGVHIHTHRHDDGTTHLHAHAHAPGEGHGTEAHAHAGAHRHAHEFPGRAVLVGLVHGMAGSAALLLLTIQTVGSLALGLAYIALFGVGSIVGMAALSAVIAVPLKASERFLARVWRGVEITVGAGTVVVGLLTIGRAAGWIAG